MSAQSPTDLPDKIGRRGRLLHPGSLKIGFWCVPIVRSRSALGSVDVQTRRTALDRMVFQRKVFDLRLWCVLDFVSDVLGPGILQERPKVKSLTLMPFRFFFFAARSEKRRTVLIFEIGTLLKNFVFESASPQKEKCKSIAIYNEKAKRVASGLHFYCVFTAFSNAMRFETRDQKIKKGPNGQSFFFDVFVTKTVMPEPLGETLFCVFFCDVVETMSCRRTFINML